MHPANPFNQAYDLPALAELVPELKEKIRNSRAGRPTIDFADAEAVKFLNKALLNKYYGIGIWDVPPGYLCPPVPGRLDYLLHLADLLRSNGEEPGKNTRILDIGTGANLIYPLLGSSKEFNWRFVATETDTTALKTAQAIIQANDLGKRIELRRQKDKQQILEGVIGAGEYFAASICNPPFYGSAEEAEQHSQAKWHKLGRARFKQPTIRNFGGRDNELWTQGGEKAFLLRLIQESKEKPDACGWYTSLLSAKRHETPIVQALKREKAKRVEVIPMGQGSKVSRMVAWQWK
ncbi:23S rRNA (adenine(1618)-N(6))-methyltransferase RlmF [Lewinellaceae bacterium SD302]|nr:23S rRNA (adenine(1618)-N(6))-methyltransferase RlmF [Lewinellaceae bacterium SD302]